MDQWINDNRKLGHRRNKEAQNSIKYNQIIMQYEEQKNKIIKQAKREREMARRRCQEVEFIIIKTK